MNKYLLLVILTVSPLAALGKSDCETQATTDVMADCSGRDSGKAEIELNKIYKLLMNSLVKIENDFMRDYPNAEKLHLRTNLISSQKAWLQYRLNYCKLEGNIVLSDNPNRGDYPALAEQSCETNLAKVRTSELIDLMHTYDINSSK